MVMSDPNWNGVVELTTGAAELVCWKFCIFPWMKPETLWATPVTVDAVNRRTTSVQRAKEGNGQRDFILGES